MRYWEPRHFKPQEFVPKELYEYFGRAALLAMDARILWTADALRDYFGKPITINDWHIGGKFSQRGLRTDARLLDRTPLTQHRFGRAIDLTISGVTADEFRRMAKKGMLKKELTYVTRIENGVSWIHLDCAAVSGAELVFFNAG